MAGSFQDTETAAVGAAAGTMALRAASRVSKSARSMAAWPQWACKKGDTKNGWFPGCFPLNLKTTPKTGTLKRRHINVDPQMDKPVDRELFSDLEPRNSGHVDHSHQGFWNLFEWDA